MLNIKDITNTIIQGDCLEVLKDMETASVDLIFCSPPYEDVRTYDIGFKLKGQDWVDWAFERYIECDRVSKGLVAWVVEGKTKQFKYSATPILLSADLHRAGIKLRKPPIFHRVGIPGSGGPDWLRNDYEFIVCSSSGRLPWSDNTAFGHPPKWAPGGEMSHRLSDGTRKNQWGGSSKSTGGERGKDGKLTKAEPQPSHRFSTPSQAARQKGEKGNADYNVPKKANPGNVIKCNVGGGQMGSKLAHENEAPFPESLAEKFLLSFCPPDGIVLDIFSGSGTTAATAVKNGRNYIGVDIRQSQVDLATKRVQEAKDSMGLFGGLK